MPPCRSYWIRVSAKCRILAARGLRLAVKLSVLLSISLVFLLSCSSDPSSDLTDVEHATLIVKACNVLQEAGYYYDNLTGLLSNGFIYGEVNDDIIGMAATITNAYPNVPKTAAFCLSVRPKW